MVTLAPCPAVGIAQARTALAKAQARQSAGRIDRDGAPGDTQIATLWAELERRQGEPLNWALKLAPVTAFPTC